MHLKDQTIYTLKSLQKELKTHALSVGQFGPPFIPERYDERDKSQAFRCVSYNIAVRQISALENAIEVLENCTQGRLL